MPWIDVTDPDNWTAQRIVFDDPTPGSCTPLSYSEDGTDVYTWSTDHWVLPALSVTANSSWANVPTLRYVGGIDRSTISGVRVSGYMVGAHTIPITGAACLHIAVGFVPSNFIDGTIPRYPDDCGLSGAVINYGDTFTDGETFALETSGADGEFDAFLDNLLMIPMSNDTDYCGPFFVSDDVAALFGLNITKIEVLAPSESVFWTNFLGCQELS
jgi:hypothetical protein